MEQSGNDIRKWQTNLHDGSTETAIKIISNLIQDVANLRIINLIESEKYVLHAPTFYHAKVSNVHLHK